MNLSYFSNFTNNFGGIFLFIVQHCKATQNTNGYTLCVIIKWRTNSKKTGVSLLTLYFLWIQIFFWCEQIKWLKTELAEKANTFIIIQYHLYIQVNKNVSSYTSAISMLLQHKDKIVRLSVLFSKNNRVYLLIMLVSIQYN